jgi:hypothetical protein
MARVLIVNSSLCLCVLFRDELERLGHSVVTDDGADAEADIALVEPTDPRSFAVARALRDRLPELRIVVTSPDAPSKASRRLNPVLHLEYPFTVHELRVALSIAAWPATSKSTHEPHSG